MLALAALFLLLGLSLSAVVPSRVESKFNASQNIHLHSVMSMYRARNRTQAASRPTCAFMHDVLYPSLSRAQLANSIGEHGRELLHPGSLCTPRPQDLDNQLLQPVRCLLRAHDQRVIADEYRASAGPRRDVEQGHVGFSISA